MPLPSVMPAEAALRISRAITHSLVHASVQAQPRKVMHVIRVVDHVLTLAEVR